MPSSWVRRRGLPPFARPPRTWTCSSTACGSAPTPPRYSTATRSRSARTRSSPSTTAASATPSSSTPAPSPTWRPPPEPPPAGGHRAAGWSASRMGASTRSAASGWYSAVTPARTSWSAGRRSRAATPRSSESPEGYVLNDFSVNGTYVNGERVGRQHLLARADVIRIGHDEFRFYADVALPTPPRRRRSVPQVTAPQPPPGRGARLSDTMHGLPPLGAQRRGHPDAAAGGAPGLAPGPERCAQGPAAPGQGAGGQHRAGGVQRRGHRRCERQHQPREAAAPGRRYGC